MSRPRRRLLLIVALVGFVGLGLPDGVLGTAWPFARADFGRPVEDLGFVITVLTISSALMAAVSGRVGRRLGTGRLLFVALVLATAGGVMWAAATSWGMFVTGAALIGLGGGFFDPAINHHVARHHGTRSMNALHLAFGLGATIGPIAVVGALGVTGTWRWGLASVVVLYVPVAVVVALTRDAWGAPRVRPAVADDLPPLRPWRVMRTLSWFATATGIEVAGGQWAFTILQDRGSSDEVAAAFVAAYWGGLTGGRLFGAVFGNRLGRGAVLGGSLLLLAAGYAWLWVDPGGTGAVGLPIAGAGMALVFPTLVLATEEVHGDASDLVVGWSFASAALGAAVLPWGAGLIGARIGTGVIPLVLGCATAAFAVLLAPLLRQGRERPPALHSPDG
jgi:fucose permease